MEKVGRYHLNLTTGSNLATPIMKQTDTMELVMTAQKTEHHLFRKPDQMFHGNTTMKKLIRPTKLWDILQNRP